ncbi:sigma-70 family RNA polymerase sigma factor, partial [bacterium]|nr:sigma-70 family RNA polymerase sigma factor [bacterium]
EVLQETALKALKNWNQFRGDSQVSTWLYRIASNTCLSRKRNRTVFPVDPIILEEIAHHTEPLLMASDAEWSRDPLAHTLNDELRSVLDEAISKLPDSYRLVFIMRDMEGMSGDEASKALDISNTNVKVRLHRARVFLRNELDIYLRTDKGASS